MVELISPPITVMARGFLIPAPFPTLKAMGRRPIMVEAVVMRIGLSLFLEDSTIASKRSIPDIILSFIVSTKTMDVLTLIPAKITKPMKTRAETLISKNPRIMATPTAHRGTEKRIMTG